MSGTGDGAAAPATTVLTGGTPAAAAPAAGAAPAAADTKVADAWYTKPDFGIDAAHHPYIQNKGWKAPSDMLDSYVSMEKVVGLERSGQADRIIIKPKDLSATATDEEKTAHAAAMKDYQSKVFSVPKDASGYSLTLPEAFKDNPIYQKAGDIFLKAGAPPAIAQPLMDAFTEMQGTADKQVQDAINAEEATLKQDPKYAENTAIAARAVTAAGLTKEEASLLGAVLGPKRALEAFTKLGAAFKEGATPPGNGGGEGGKGGSFGMTREQAAAKAADLRKDAQFQANYLSPNPAIRNKAITEIEALDKIASGA